MYAPPAGTAVSVAVDGVAEAERIFKGLSDQGTVTMPFQKTFWSAGFGMLTDRFGVPWMVNTNQPA
jgi:PhnB protein